MRDRTPALSLVRTAKITPPRLPRVLERPRLFKRLEQALDRRLVLLLGPAAQGKTTLAATYLGKSDLPSAWLNLSPEDSDPVNLVHSLAAALESAFPRTAALTKAKEMLSFSQGPRASLPMYRDWLRSLFESVPTSNPLFVVLDGLDNLREKAASFDFLQVMTREAPDQVRLILLSRFRPHLNLEELKVRRQALILESEELAFTPQETRAFFAQVSDNNFTKEQTDKIHRLLEGWPGGLILFSEFLEGLPADARSDYLDGLGLNRFKRDVFQYFGENIFGTLKPETREFLAQVSVFEVLEPDLIQELRPGSKADETLAWLANKNFFVTAIPTDRGKTVYRFHRIFREFLRSKLESGVSSEQKQALMERAAGLMRQNGNLEQALRLFLELGSFGQAAKIIRDLGFDLLRMGRFGDLAHWIGELPPEKVREDPWLQVFLCMTRRWTQTRVNLEVLPLAREAFRLASDQRGEFLCLALELEACFAVGSPWSRISQLMAQSEHALSQGDPNEHFYERTLLWGKIGLSYSIRGNPRKSLPACQRAYLGANRLGDLSLQCETLPHYIDSLVQLSEFDKARKLLKKLDKISRKSNQPTIDVLALIVRVFLALFMGKIGEAAPHLAEAQQLVEEYGLLNLQPPVLLYKLMFSVFNGDHAQVDSLGVQMYRMGEEMGHQFIKGVAKAFMGLSAYQMEEFGRAEELLHDGLVILGSDEGWAEAHQHCFCQSLALAHSHLDQPNTYDDELQASLDYFEDIDSPCRLGEAILSTALVRMRQGRDREARLFLNKALTHAEKMQAPYFPWINKADLARACVSALELDLPKAEEFILCLARANHGLPLERELLGLEARASSGRLKQVRGARLNLRRQTTPLLKVEALGMFQVRRGEYLIPRSEWRGSQSKRLLKALLSHGARAVPRDLLMESLWPGSDPANLGKTFKVALHRLRKVLEPDMDNTLGSLYLHLEGNLVSLDNELCLLDTDEFQALRAEGEKLARENKGKAALKKLEQAVKVYRGDFLPEELYSPWAQAPRERLRQDHLGLLMDLAELNRDKGSLRQAAVWFRRVLAVDPCQEEACQRLMVVLQKLGQHGQALEACEKLRQALRQDLDVAPDSRTLALYNKIKLLV